MLDQLELRNFKAFRSADVPLGPLTLLTGLNSSGKSSVLQALALLHQSYERGYLLNRAGGIARRLSPQDVLRMFGESGFLLNGDLVSLGTGLDVLHEDFSEDEAEITIAMSEGRNRFSWTVGYEAEQNLLPLTRFDLPPWSEAHAESKDAPLTPAYFTGGFQYLHADRISPVEFYPRDHAVVGRGFLGVRGEHTVNFLRHHAQLRTEVPEGPLRHPRADTPLLLDQAAAWMGDLCPGVDIKADAIEGTDAVRLSYTFAGSLGSSSRRRPGNVGFGLTYSLPIVTACLTAGPGSLVLLENPEAHLHPQGQTKMAVLAAAAAAHGAQLVVETHSDHVINGARLAVKRQRLAPEDLVLHYFRGDGTGVDVVTPKVGRDGLLDQWPEGFFDELENTLDQLLS